MGKLNVLKVVAFNFKGFERLDFDFLHNDLVILGGKNGYGKTTVFDAIELVVTGKISRLSHFSEFHNKRFTYNEVQKPLVFNTSLEYVKIQVLFRNDKSRFWLKRQAKVAELSNPLSFEPFKKVYCAWATKDSDIMPEDKDFVEVPEGSLNEILSDSIVEDFGFLHYLDQEDSDTFIKSTTKNRQEGIRSLFEIQDFEASKAKLEQCKNILYEIVKSRTNIQNDMNTQLEQLMSSVSYDTNSTGEYIRLTSSQRWDQEDLPLTLNSYKEIIGEYGILDNAEYYLRNKPEYRAFSIKRLVHPYYNEKSLNEIAQFVHFINEGELLQLYDILQGTLKKIIDSRDWEWIGMAFGQSRPVIERYISRTDIDRISDNVKSLYERSRDFSKIQRDYSDLLHRRNALSTLFESDSFDRQSNCPLCGQEYERREVLISQMKKEGELLKTLIERENGSYQTDVKNFLEDFNNIILKPIDTILSERGVTDEVVKSVRNQQIRKFLGRLEKDFKVTLDRKATFLETSFNVIDVIGNIHGIQIKEGIDYNRIESFIMSYGKDLIQTAFTLENIEKKRNYIKSQWIAQSNHHIVKLKDQIKENANILANSDKKYKGITKIIKELERQKKKYIETLISDIEILFYIYSGRIMQNCHYGRGVFLKFDGSPRAINQMVLFVVGDYNHDVDALLNASSGQLSAIVISFLLSLNKLYGDSKFIAIDDPVQTMDDMNFWGLIETIRHEFNDYFVLMSTHEERFGALMRYKTAMMGMKSHYFDTRNLRSGNKDEFKQ